MGINIQCFLRDWVKNYTALPKGWPTSAWPDDRTTFIGPTAMGVNWNNTKDDAIIYKAMQEANAAIRAKAASLGQAPLVHYPNYAASWWQGADIYGKNLPLLQKLKQTYDPNSVMNLTGGFKFLA
jgi:FAD/FMN-containing dehydrogenase